MKQVLNGQDWILKGYKPNEPYFNLTQGKLIGFEFGEQIQSFSANVPGSIHNDLMRAGKIKDPYIGNNAKEVEWVENRDWVYIKRFSCSEYQNQRHHTLVFEGLNHEAIVVFNGMIIGDHHNVNTSCRFDISHLLEHENELLVIIKQTVREQGQAGGKDTLRHQVQYFGYGWDFGTRLVGIGIHKDVYILHEDVQLTDIYLVPSLVGMKGKIHFTANISEISELKFKLWIDENDIYTYTYRVVDSINLDLWIDDIKKWYPNGEGDPNLYKIEIFIKENDDWAFHSKYRLGFKSVRYLKNSGSKDALPYTLEINEKKVWIKGVCITNFDHMVGRVTDGDYHYYLSAMKEMNVNLVRLWGGGIRERSTFYDLCDDYGIMVWQDFFQSQSSFKGTASQDHGFLSELSQSAIQTIKELRHHVSTVIYCGGNELKDESMKPLTTKHPNLMMLEQLVLELHPQVHFYPTTPSGPNFSFIDDGQSHQNHNVHGPWMYSEHHFHHYNKGDWLFQGEFGVNGLSDERTLMHITPENEISALETQDTEFYLARNSNWWNSSKRDHGFAGRKHFNSLHERVWVSQWIQANALSYAIERNRSRAFTSSGNNLWQLNEPWPNVECTSLIDYYKRKKLAYYAVKKAYQPMIIMAKYDNQFISNCLNTSIEVSNFMFDIETKITIELWSQNERLFHKVLKQEIHKGTTLIEQIHFYTGNSFFGVLFLRLSLVTAIFHQFKTYMFMSKDFQWLDLIRESKECIFDNTPQYVTVMNPSDHVWMYKVEECYRDLIDEPWLILFPSEKRVFTRKVKKTHEYAGL